MFDDLDFKAARASLELRDVIVPEPMQLDRITSGMSARRRRKRRIGVLAASAIVLGATSGGLRFVERNEGGGPQIVATRSSEGSAENEGHADGDSRSAATEGSRALVSAAECFTPTYMPRPWSSGPDPGPALPGGPLDGPRENVMHWGSGAAEFIDVASTIEPHPIGSPEEEFTVLGGPATGNSVGFSTGETLHLVSFRACERYWVLSGFRISNTDLRRFAEGLAAR